MLMLMVVVVVVVSFPVQNSLVTTILSKENRVANLIFFLVWQIH